MLRTPDMRKAMNAYFAAKALMFADVPTFRLLDAGPLRCFHNHPGWPEVDAFYAVAVEPREVIRAVRACQPHPKHMVTVFTDRPESLLSAYEALRYRPLPGPQPFMARSLSTLPSVKDAVPVCRVETHADMCFINSWSQIMAPAHLNDSLYRYYYVEQDGKPACWGRCVTASPQAIYVAGIETLPPCRRRGMATSLMNRMHADAADTGAEQSVLCSTTMAQGLYQAVGYALLAHMQAFVPRDANAD